MRIAMAATTCVRKLFSARNAAPMPARANDRRRWKGWFFNGSCTQASAIVSEPFTVIAGTEFEEGARLYTLNIEGDSASIDSVALAEFTFKVVDHNTVFTDERVSEVIGTRVHLTGDCDGDP